MNFIDKILKEAKQQQLYEKELFNMLFHKVISSNLDAIAYNSKEELLQIKFKGGGKYEYYDVPPNVFRQLKRAKSKGRYFWRAVRDDYDYRKLSI